MKMKATPPARGQAIGFTRIKEGLRETLRSEPFRKNFRKMIEGSIEEGYEHQFCIEIQISENGSFDLVLSDLLRGGNDHVGKIGQTYVVLRNQDEDYDPMDFAGFYSIVDLHTHTHNGSMHESVSSLPSGKDIENCFEDGCFGILVPVDMGTGESSLVAFQPYTQFSHVAYMGLCEEMRGGWDDFHLRMLREAQERRILNSVYFSKRRRLRINKPEIEDMLARMSLRRLKAMELDFLGQNRFFCD